MPGNWREVARRAGHAVDGRDSVAVALDGGSTQTVHFRVDADGQVLRAWSIIARAAVVASVTEEPRHYAWERNRLSDLVGFTADQHGRLVGEVWMPLQGLTVEEFRLYVSELARVCDWHEFRLTGADEF